MNLVQPMFAMVVLTYVVLLVMFRTRVRAVFGGQLRISFFKTYTADAPEAVIVTARHYSNLFELPVLFYAACAVAMIRNLETDLMHTWAWLFVASRVAHAIVHLGRNNVRHRMFAFATGVFAVAAMWVTIFLAVGI